MPRSLRGRRREQHGIRAGRQAGFALRLIHWLHGRGVLPIAAAAAAWALGVWGLYTLFAGGASS